MIQLMAACAWVAIVRRRPRSAGPAGQALEMRQMLADSQLLVTTLDRDGRITYANARAAELTGIPAEKLAGRRWDSTFGAASGHGGRLVGGEVESVLVTPDGEHRVIAWNDTPTLDGRGRVTGLGRIGSDITSRRHAEDRVAFLARYDELTRLPNRALFIEWVELALQAGRSHGRSVAVLRIDIDNFRLVNESFGHAAADQLLGQYSHRLRDAAEGAELVARDTGDEFLVLLADADSPTASRHTHDHPADVAQMAEAVAGRLSHLLRQPFQCMGDDVYLNVSVGIALSPRDGTTTEELMTQARLAIGRHRLLDLPAQAVDVVRMPPRQEITMVSRLHRAIDTRQFALRYQPVVDLRTGRIRGAEALIRWLQPGGSEISPAEFIPLAERSGLIGPITAWVVEEVCRQQREWSGRGLELELAFNLPLSLWEPAAIRNVLATVRRHGVAAPDLLVEITESTVMRESSDNAAVLGMIGSAGLRLALDDFGTGHSSLARLKQVPATTLKIDRSFVRDLPADEESAALVVTIIDLARNLGMAPLAEGIETEEQRRFLCDNGCELGQGFLFSRPVPPDEFERLCATTGVELTHRRAA